MIKRALGLILGLTFMVVSVSWAQVDPNTSNSKPADAAPVRVGPPGMAPVKSADAPNEFGSARNISWVDATHFAATLDTGAPLLHYFTHHYYNSPGSASPVRYFATLDLPPGAVVDTITPILDDNSAGNDISWSLQVYQFDVTGSTFTSNVYGSGSTTGQPGFTYVNSSITPNQTISYLQLGTNNMTVYHLAIDIANDTAFAGFLVGWKRTVSPDPATATFTDVPVGNPQHRFVEALVASGITAGCGGGQYCPNQAVTRGQMAVFLSVALGLQWGQ